MKKKIIGIFVCMLLITISVCTLSASADSESELRVGVFGASMLALRQAGGIIWNDGFNTIQDVQYTFTITGGSNDSINITISGDAGDGDMEVNQVLVTLEMEIWKLIKYIQFQQIRLKDLDQ